LKYPESFTHTHLGYLGKDGAKTKPFSHHK
jgi:hypothetical protein